MPEQPLSGTIDSSALIDLFDTLLTNPHEHISSSMNLRSLPTRSPLSDESVITDPSNTFNRSENTAQTGGQITVAIGSTLSMLVPSPQQAPISLQSRVITSQSVPLASLLQSSITWVPRITSMSSHELASIHPILTQRWNY